METEDAKINYNKKVYNIRGEKYSHLFKTIRAKRFYELDLLEAIRSRRRKGIYIDAGANIGNHSIYFAGECLSTKVYSFEPYPYTFNILKYNIEYNNFKEKIVGQNVALSDRLCYLGIKLPTNICNIGRIEMVEGGEEVRCSTLDVSCLDPCIKDDIAVIKIDVQSYEIKVLRGAVGVLEKYKPLLSIECTTLRELKQVETFLRPYNYKRVGKYCATPTYIFE